MAKTEGATAATPTDTKNSGSNLFSPFTLRSITLRNRIAVSPMCQYASVDGFANEWHLVHLGSRAIGGAGLVVLEASGVEARGRICPDDLGIYKDEHISELSHIVKFIEKYGATPGIQIAHAGRKASTKNPWKIGNRHEKQELSEEEGGWQPVAPSPVPFTPGARAPHELTVEEIKTIQHAFREAAVRAHKAGFKWLEIHGAHGYLINSFYSPLANFRTDSYGGSFENRIRFLVETTKLVREVWPENLPLTVRLSASDWVEGGWAVDDSVELAKILKGLGVDLIDCSSAYVRPGDKYNYGPGWQVPLAEKVRHGADIATGAVGMITDAHQANDIISQGKADIVFLARELMRDPYWPYHAAKELEGKLGIDAKKVLPPNYSYAI